MSGKMASLMERQIKVLFVDDDEMMRIFFRDIFWVHGRDDHYQVTLAQTITEADKIVNDPATRPDIIFLDLMIPEKRGGEATSDQIERSVNFIKKIKGDKALSRINVIVFSGHKDPVFQKKLLDMGASGYMVKGDFMPKEIIEYVDKIECG